jgi:ribosome-binding protein aMBF1 (putative translation factor)
MVMLEETEFERLMIEADLWEPKLPDPFPDGNYPAVEYACASLAINIIRDRRKLGLSQAELARRANIRLETLVRIESGARRPSNVRAVEKIERALCKVEKERSGGAQSGAKPGKKKAREATS